MEILANPAQIQSTFKKLLNKYAEYYWLVAWADNNFEISKVLQKNQHKIKKICVGLHFYGTDPAFIRRYQYNSNVKFRLQESGTFHAKVYLFYNNPQDWSLLVGSANFTKGGFEKNLEVMQLVTATDTKSNNVLTAVRELIDKEFKLCRNVTPAFLKNYTTRFKKVQRANPNQNTLAEPIQSLDWIAYLQKLYKEDYTQRIDLIDWVNKRFSKYKSFHNVPEEERKIIAGFGKSEEVAVGCFGSTNARGYFKETVIKRPEIISAALREIPKTGPVLKEHYIAFVKKFSKVSRAEELACATRLLALIRPDYFVNYNGKNKKAMRKALHIKSAVTFENYWEQIVQKFIDASFGGDAKDTKKEIEIYNCRVALTDCIYFKWT